MTTEVTVKTHRLNQPAIFKFMDGDAASQKMIEVYDKVARRAYELFESRGRQDGQDLDDWLRAESEVLIPIPVEVSETDDELIIQAEVPGFRDEDVDVRVEPHRVIVSGKRQQIRDQKKRKTVYSERRSDEIFRMFNLPKEIDPDKVTVALNHGTLEVAIAKVHPGGGISVADKAA